MLLTKEFIEKLALTPKEIIILKTLEKSDTLLIADISKNSKIARMTLYPVLDDLKDRRLVNYRRAGKRKYWYMESEHHIAKELTNISSQISSEKVEVRKEKTGFIIHRNTKSLYSIFEEVAALNKGERVKVIQPTASALSVMNNLKWQEEIKPINEAIVKKGIVVEGLLQDDYYSAIYKSIYPVDPVRAKAHIQSFIGRATDMVFVPKEYLNVDSEFLMFRNKGFIINWNDEVAIEIQNKEMLNFLEQLFMLARGYGNKIDQNKYLTDFLTKHA